MNPTDKTSTPSSAPDYDTGFNEESGSASGEPTKQKIRRVAGRAVDQTKERVSAVAGQGKEAAADRLGGYSDKLRAAAQSSSDENDANIAQLANAAADRLQQAADYVREADFGRMRQDAADIAQRHPALFMGGMFAAGLVLGNLAKASVQSLRDNSDGYAEDPDSDGYTGEYSGAEDDDVMGDVPSYGETRREEP